MLVMQIIYKKTDILPVCAVSLNVFKISFSQFFEECFLKNIDIAFLLVQDI